MELLMQLSDLVMHSITEFADFMTGPLPDWFVQMLELLPPECFQFFGPPSEWSVLTLCLGSFVALALFALIKWLLDIIF